MLHLPYGGSTASRSINCPGWLKKSEGVPHRSAGPAAIAGSMHHEVMEKCQRDETTPEQHLGLVYKEDGVELEFSDDDLTLSEIAYAATNKKLDELDIDILMVEPFVQLIPGLAGGSIDLLGLSADGKRLLVLDYKFGKGAVEVKENYQLLFYALCASVDPATCDLLKNVETLDLVVIQPQLKGGVFHWSCAAGKLKPFHKKFKAAMKSDKVVAGDHCRYCPSEPFCDVKRKRIRSANVLGARLQEELQASADMVAEVEQWVKSTHEEMYLQMTRGVTIEGWKIVEKRATRKWIDETHATAALLDAGIDPKVFTKTTTMTAPQTETALKKAKIEFDLDELIEKKSSGTTMAPVTDDREAVTVGDVPDNLKNLENLKGVKK